MFHSSVCIVLPILYRLMPVVKIIETEEKTALALIFIHAFITFRLFGRSDEKLVNKIFLVGLEETRVHCTTAFGNNV